jgi:thioredoxin 1
VALVIVVGLVVVVAKNRLEPPSVAPLAEPHGRETVVATVNGQDITLGELDGVLLALPPEVRSMYGSAKHEFLEEMITRQVLLQEARRLNIGQTEAYRAALEAADDRRDTEARALIQALLSSQVALKPPATEQELLSFYQEHQVELPAGVSFEEVKEQLRPIVEQLEQRESVASYVADLRARATIWRAEQWIAAQAALAADNPLDRALGTGRPVVADFGRGTCIPCKMMKPILDELQKEYAGRAEILIIQIDEYPAVTQRVGIRAIPTQVFYDAKGKEVYRHEGFMPREDVVARLTGLGVK